MARPPTPLFLERRSYRLRRMMDAVRVLPMVGLGLWMIPLLWGGGDGVVDGAGGDPVSMSQALLFIFLVWMTLIVAAGLLWVRTRHAIGDTPGSGQS